LRFGAETAASVLREQRDADLVVRSGTDGTPRHPPGATAIIETDGEVRRGAADQAVLLPPALKFPNRVHAEAKPLELARSGRVPLELKEMAEFLAPDRRQDRLLHVA
jgi:hypothetical protein